MYWFPFQFFFQYKTPYQLAEEQGHSDIIKVYKVIYLLNKYIATLTVEQKHTFRRIPCNKVVINDAIFDHLHID